MYKLCPRATVINPKKSKIDSIGKDKGYQFKVNYSWIYVGSYFISLQIPSEFSDICDNIRKPQY